MSSLTNEQALERAMKELTRLTYESELGFNAGIQTIASNKVAWLSKIISMAQSYSNFHWTSCDLIMPENLPENAGKKVIPCIVSVKSRYPNGKPNVQKRMRQQCTYTESGWTWSQGKGDRITHWAMLPDPPEV